MVPSRYPQNPELGIWVGTQRTQYRLFQRAKEIGQLVTGSAAMNEDRIHELEELGFVWALRGGEGKRDESSEDSGSHSNSNTHTRVPLPNSVGLPGSARVEDVVAAAAAAVGVARMDVNVSTNRLVTEI